jgi:WD40 repeat protein
VLWDLEAGIIAFELDDGPSDHVSYSSTRTYIAYSFRHGTEARVVNVSQRSVEAFLDTGDNWTVAFSPDGTQVTTGGDSATVRLWDAKTWRLERELDGHNARVRALAYTPDGERLASRRGPTDVVCRTFL